MKTQSIYYGLFLVTINMVLSFSTFAEPNLNQIDVQQQQRQQQQNLAQQALLQSRSDVRLDIKTNDKGNFPTDEKSYFDIYKISLLAYSADN